MTNYKNWSVIKGSLQGLEFFAVICNGEEIVRFMSKEGCISYLLKNKILVR